LYVVLVPLLASRRPPHELTKSAIFQLDAFATPTLRKDLEKLKADYERVNDERTAVLSEIDDLRTRYVGMERRLEAETESHCETLDRLRDERESRDTLLYTFSLRLFFFPSKHALVTRLPRNRKSVRRRRRRRRRRRHNAFE